MVGHGIWSGQAAGRCYHLCPGVPHPGHLEALNRAPRPSASQQAHHTLLSPNSDTLAFRAWNWDSYRGD